MNNPSLQPAGQPKSMPPDEASADSELNPDEPRRDDPRALAFYGVMNAITAAVCLAVGVILTAFGVVYGLVTSNMPGPGLFPFLLGILLAFLSLFWLLNRKQRSITSADEEVTVPDRQGIAYIGFTIAAGLLFIVMLGALGYQLTMILYVGALLKFVSKHGWILTLAMSVAFSFGSYLLFVGLLGVQLPLAQIPFLNSLGL